MRSRMPMSQREILQGVSWPQTRGMLHLGQSDGVTLNINYATLQFYSEFMCNAHQALVNLNRQPSDRGFGGLTRVASFRPTEETRGPLEHPSLFHYRRRWPPGRHFQRNM